MLKCSTAYFSLSNPSYQAAGAPVKVACASFKLYKLWVVNKHAVNEHSLFPCSVFMLWWRRHRVPAGKWDDKFKRTWAQCRAVSACTTPLCLAPAGPVSAEPPLFSFLLPWFLGWRHPAQDSPLCWLLASFWAFCFKGSALRMFSFSCTCRCDSLPRDVSFFIWENHWCVLWDGHTRPRNYQHVQTSAIVLQTQPAGRIFAISPR